MTIQRDTRPETQVQSQRISPKPIHDVHTVIIEIGLWKPVQNTLLTVHSSLYTQPVQQYATFRSIYDAIRYYREQYELAAFILSNVKIYHVHADMFTAEFTATH